MLDTLLDDTFRGLARALEQTQPALESAEIAMVASVGAGVATVRGFSELNANELVRFPAGLFGLAANIREGEAGVMMLGDTQTLKTGDGARRTKRVADAPVGEGLLGRVVNALGQPIDDKGELKTGERRSIERPAPPIMHRAPVETPLQTGIKAIDAAIPIGRGQRELIVGDRQTGKTSITIDAILNQKDTGVLSVYCAIGQRASAVARVVKALEDGGALERSIIVVAGGEDAPGLQYIAPYAATTIAEFFMEQGKDVLIVYDDLTRHARAYRELSLLLRRPPGREAYPGDIFYLHARLLERSTHLRDEHGAGSMTALPIIETQAQNISAYIPTNLISITDGQLYLSPSLFEKGHLPAIDIGKSVSRVGGKAQAPAYRAVAGDLRLSYSQFEELESFARFGTRLDDETRAKLDRGRRVRAALQQTERHHMSEFEQIAVLFAATEGLLDDVALDRIDAAEAAICDKIADHAAPVRERIGTGEKLTDEDHERLRKAIDDILREEGLKDQNKQEKDEEEQDKDAKEKQEKNGADNGND